MLAAVKRAVSGDEQPLLANPFAASTSHTETDAAPSPRDSSNDSVEISHYSTPPTILSGVQSAEPSEPDAAAPQKDAKPDVAAVSAAVTAAATATAASEEPRRKSVRARSSVATYSDTVLSGHAVHTRKSYRDEREFALAAATRASLAATALDDGDAPPATPSPRHARAKDPAPVSAKTSPLRKRSVLRITRRASTRVGRFSLGAASAAKALASASAALEKGRDAFDGVKERLSRSSILSRKRLRSEEDTPSRKRARFHAITPDEEEEAEKKVKAKQRPKKPWVEKGLYSGQDEEELKSTGRPNKRRTDNRKEYRKKPAFPMPMYTGALLLEHGRDFKLPFSILNPLPRDQSPKDWKNLIKSKLFRMVVGLF
jgi:[histone H3]-lysine4 N-trimethyltransferase ASH1L